MLRWEVGSSSSKEGCHSGLQRAWNSVRKTVFLSRLASPPLHLPVSNALQDVRSVIESSIVRPHWGLAKIYNGDVLPSDQAYFFLDGPDMQVVLVLLWSPGSRFLLFEGSHNQKIHKKMSEFGILVAPRGQMRREGITEVPVEMTQGGL